MQVITAVTVCLVTLTLYRLFFNPLGRFTITAGSMGGIHTFGPNVNTTSHMGGIWRQFQIQISILIEAAMAPINWFNDWVQRRTMAPVNNMAPANAILPRPLNAFITYKENVVPLIKERNPGISVQEICKYTTLHNTHLPMRYHYHRSMLYVRIHSYISRPFFFLPWLPYFPVPLLSSHFFTLP